MGIFSSILGGANLLTGILGGIGDVKGAFRDPPEYLQPGDTVELTVSKLGKQRSTVVREAE